MTKYLTLALVLIPALVLGEDSNNSALDQAHLQQISSHYTGCKPNENVISDIVSKPDGHTSWHATCNGAIYTCFIVKAGHNTGFSCTAPTQ